jgi:hypothetical protein
LDVPLISTAAPHATDEENDFCRSPAATVPHHLYVRVHVHDLHRYYAQMAEGAVKMIRGSFRANNGLDL